MLKNYFLIFLLLLVSNYSTAQEPEEIKPKKIKVGINAGPNYNALRGDSFAEQYDSQFNYFIGLSFEYVINDNISVLTNFNYENRSYKREYEGFSQTWTNTFKVEDKTTFRNINIPLLLKYKFGFYEEFFINGGFFYNHIIDVSNEMINKETGEDMSDLDFNELFKSQEYGLSLGLGMTFKLNQKNSLSIEIRDDFGISDLGDVEFGEISKTKTNTIKLILNWSLAF